MTTRNHATTYARKSVQVKACGSPAPQSRARSFRLQRRAKPDLLPRIALPALGAFIVLCSPLAAQQTRTRTLEFDSRQQEWLEQAPPPPGTPAGDLHIMRADLAAKKFSRVESRFKAFVKKHGEDNPLYPDTLVVRSAALVGRQQFDKAHEVLTRFFNEFGGMSITSDALQLEFIIAQAYLGGSKRRLMGIPLWSGVDTAYEILDMISMEYPDQDVAELAIKTKADHLFQAGEHAQAELEYARLIRDYPQTRYHRLALQRSAEAALAGFAGVDYDESVLIEAHERFQEYRLRYPEYAHREGVGLVLDGISERIAEKNYRVAAYYEKTKHLTSAVFYYRKVCNDRPETVAAVNAATRLDLLGFDRTESLKAIAPSKETP